MIFGVRALRAALPLLLAGCAGWRPGSDTFVGAKRPARQARKETSYRFGVPPDGWRPVRDVQGVQVAWVRRDIGGLIELHAQCAEQGDSSLAQYTDHLRIDWTQWHVVEQHAERILERDALRTVVDAALDGVERRAELVVFKKNGCLFDLRYSAPPATFERGRDAFATVVSGFEYPISRS